MDLALTGGYLIDPHTSRLGKHDVAFSGGRVVSADTPINNDNVREIIDVSGKYVVPGLIDLHTHVYHGGTSLGVHPDRLARRAGVTTFVDAGSAGAGNFPGFHDHVIQPSRSRILAFLNISFSGIFGFDVQVGECKDLALCDPSHALGRAKEFGDKIIGIKVRVGQNTSGANGVSPLEIAKQASDMLAKPLMAHIDRPPPSIEAVLQHLTSGDILTHCFRPFPNRPVAGDGTVRPEVLAARKRGVVFDTGHGKGSFGFETAIKMLENGFEPDVISSDVHTQCINGPAYDLLNVMSKFLALGMTLEKVVEKATIAPARAIDQSDIGHLSPGAKGDATIFHVETGRFQYVDTVGERMTADSRLVCDGLVIDGRFWAVDGD